MMTLSPLSILLGAILLGIGAWGLSRTEEFVRWAESYPRSEWPGRILTAIGLPWAAYFQLITPPVAGHPFLTNLVMGLVPVAFILILVFLKELLSVRALGGILLLSATPLFKQARLEDSSLSVLITIFTYGLVVVGIIWVLSPFRFRQWMNTLSRLETRLRGFLSVTAGLGGIFLLLGIFVFE